MISEEQWFDRFTTQLDNVLAEIRQIRVDNQRQFAELENKYVLQQVYSAQLANLHQRQDTYQQQTDVSILGVESEIQQVHRDLAAVDDRRAADHTAALKEIDSVEARRLTALEKVADQRHNDHMAVGLALLAAAVAVVVALIPVWHP